MNKNINSNALAIGYGDGITSEEDWPLIGCGDGISLGSTQDI